MSCGDGHGGTVLVDTHCHLVLLDGRGLLEEALESAAAAGVAQLVSVGLNLEDSDANRQLAERFDNVWFSVGWHPHEPDPPDATQLRALDELLAHPRAVAVGEIGLDHFLRPGYHETPPERQRRALHLMLELAEQRGKPAIVHDREAHEDVLATLQDHPAVRGVMHCFSGDAGFGRRCVEHGWMLSFSGIVTFPRSDGVQAAAAAAAADSYMLETDAPFLAPVPVRGRVNLPGHVAHTAAAVARLRDRDVEHVRAETSANARRLFGLPVPP